MSIKFINKSSNTSKLKQFATIEEMNNTVGQEGNLAIIYEKKYSDLTVGTTYNLLYLPQTITFAHANTSTTKIYLKTGGILVPYIQIDARFIQFYIPSGFSGKVVNTVKYSSSDGITYTRTDTLGEYLSVSDIYNGEYTEIVIQESSFDLIFQMFKGKIEVFEGIYIYTNESWQIAPTQLNSISDYVYKKNFYGKNGVEKGTLQNNTNLNKQELLKRIEVYSSICNLSTTETNLNNLFDGYNGIYAPFIDTINVTTMKYLFQNCINLKEIPLLNTSNVTEMSYIFNKCKSIETIPLLNTSNVTGMTYAFSNCSNLKNIPLIDTSKVNSFYYYFSYCTSLKTIPLLNTSGSKTFNYMFSNCTSLEEIPLLDTSNGTAFAFMFEKCTNLQTVPVININNALNINNMFTGCTSLSNTSLNNILLMCKNATTYTGTKTLKYIGLTSEQATICTTLSNYSAFTSAGWTTGY